MFARITRAPALDPAQIEKLWVEWHEKIAPDAGGWIGSTAGISDKGDFFSVVRYEFEALARSQDRREEQIKWWTDFSTNLGDIEVAEAHDSDVLLVGGKDAGFVQFIRGRAREKERMRSVNLAMEDLLLKHRPDIVGSEIIWHDDDRFTKIAFFSSEDAARLSESREFPGGVKAMFEELMGLIEDVEFLNMYDPWLTAPSRAQNRTSKLD